MEIVSFDSEEGGVECADPLGISFFGEFREAEVYFVKTGLKTLDGAPARIAVVFFFRERGEEIDDIGGVFTPVSNQENTREHSKRFASDIVWQCIETRHIRLQKAAFRNGYFDRRRCDFFGHRLRNGSFRHRCLPVYHRVSFWRMFPFVSLFSSGGSSSFDCAHVFLASRFSLSLERNASFFDFPFCGPYNPHQSLFFLTTEYV